MACGNESSNVINVNSHNDMWLVVIILNSTSMKQLGDKLELSESNKGNRSVPGLPLPGAKLPADGDAVGLIIASPILPFAESR